jgi:hypothetical protein
MLIAPWFCPDRDDEMAHGEKLPIARTDANAPIADRRLNMLLAGGSRRAAFECFMMVSFGSPQPRGKANLHRWFGKYNSSTIELSMS